MDDRDSCAAGNSSSDERSDTPGEESPQRGDVETGQGDRRETSEFELAKKFSINTLLIGVVIGILSILGSLLLTNLRIALSVTVGLVIGLINFDLIRRIGEKILDQSSQKKYGYATLFVAKYFGLFTVMFFLITILGLEIVGFALGISTVFLALLISAIYSN